MNEQITIDQIQQCKAKDIVFLGSRMLTAQEAATELAYKLHGLSGWQGVLGNGLQAESGLMALANKALRKVSKDAKVQEVPLSGCNLSVYYPYWK